MVCFLEAKQQGKGIRNEGYGGPLPPPKNGISLGVPFRMPAAPAFNVSVEVGKTEIFGKGPW